MNEPVALPARSEMVDAEHVVCAALRWLDTNQPPGVVFVPRSLARQKTRYGRVQRKGTAAASAPGVAILSGASSGLGRELVRRLRDRGWRVAALARNAERLRAEFGDDEQVLRLPADVSDPARMLEVVAHTVDHFGGVDLLVNNAGSSWIGPALELETREFRRVFETNFFGYFHLTRASLPSLATGRGTILNILSTTAIDPAFSALPYSCAKAAQAALSDQLKEDLRPRGVRVVDLFPGNIRTEFFDSARTPDGQGVQVPDDAMPVSEVADAAMALLDGDATTAIVPRDYGRLTLRQHARRLRSMLRGR